MLFKYLALASTASATCLHGLTKFKRAEGEEVKVGTFGYTATNGPLNWASLDPANEACKTGKQQSPINIDDSVALATEAPILDIPEQKVEFENLGTTVEVIVNGTTKFAGTDFRLKQFHVHTPSEHRIGEEYFPLEVHMVHEGVSNPNSLAVISVLFQMSTGTPSPLISGLTSHVAAIATPGTKTEIESLDFAELINHVQTTPLFQYTGSLTTPPCAEGLTFLVTKEPLNLDVETYNALKGVVKFNSRYTQNVLGEENMIAVAEKSGTEQAIMPKQKVGEKNATTTATPTETVAAGAEAKGPFTKGQTLVITEIQGTPTSMVGVVVKRDWKA